MQDDKLSCQNAIKLVCGFTKVWYPSINLTLSRDVGICIDILPQENNTFQFNIDHDNNKSLTIGIGCWWWNNDNLVQRELLTAHHHLEAIQICFCHVYLLAHKIICISWKVMEEGLSFAGETNANNRMTKQIQAWRPPILVHSFYDYKNGGVYFGLQQCGLFDVQSVKSIWSTLLFSILITLIMSFSLSLSYIDVWLMK